MMNQWTNALVCGWLLACFLMQAGEPSTPPAPKNPPQNAPQKTPKVPAPDADPDDPLAKEKANRYKVPESADSDGLVDFCLKLQDYEPEDDADAEVHDRRMPRAVKRACRKILQLEKDKESDNARFARRMILAMSLDTATEFDTPKTDRLLAKVREFLISPNVIAEDADVASALADFLGAHPSPKAVEWSQKIGADLAKHEIPEVASAGRILLGTAKRLSLVGKPLHVRGTTLDGKAFDLAELKGKVVLIEFWATWCSHCVEGIPHLKRSYETFHANGFEIVAISADEERAELVDFLNAEKLPWINLYEPGGKHPALDDFGINAFPSTLLVGKDGNVIALDLRDEALTGELEKQFGLPKSTKDRNKNEPGPKMDPKKELPDDKEDAQESIEQLKKKYSF